MKDSETPLKLLESFINSVQGLEGKTASVLQISPSGLKIGGDNDRCTNEESEACKETLNTRCVNRGSTDLTCIYAYNERCILTD